MPSAAPEPALQPSPKPAWLAKARAVLSSPWLGLALTAGLVWVLLQMAPLAEWRAGLAEADWRWLAVALALVVPHAALKAWRLELLLPHLCDHRLHHLHIVFGMAAMSQLPTGTVGGDVYRIARLDACGVPPAEATAATFILRIAGFAVTLILAAVAGAAVLGAPWPLLAVAFGGALLFVLARAERPPAWLAGIGLDARGEPLPGQSLWGRLRRGLGHLLRKTFAQAGSLEGRRLLAVLGASLAMYVVRALMLWLCLIALGLDAGVFAALGALAAGNLASSVPSPAGSVGLREGGIVGVLAALGSPAAPATLAALFFRAVLAVGAGTGFALTALLEAVTGQSPDKGDAPAEGGADLAPAE